MSSLSNLNKDKLPSKMNKVDIIDQHNDVVPMAAKKVWNILRVLYFMMRKEISRRKLMSDLNLMMKRGKVAGKAISSLMTFHGHNHHRNTGCPSDNQGCATAAEYEFSCSNSPASGSHNLPRNYLNDRFFSSLHVGGKRTGNGHFLSLFGCAHLPRTNEDGEEAVVPDVESLGFDDGAVMAMIEAEETDRVSELASPMLPGFGRTPLARRLRITDSPFPLKDEGDGGKVDKAAEEFIQRFYRALQKQKSG